MGRVTTKKEGVAKMSVHNSQQAGQAAKGGAIAGLWAGLALSLLMAVMNLFQNNSIWGGLKFAGVPFLGERAFEPGFDALAVLVGIICHFGVSAAWGVLFGLLFYGLSRNATLVAGAVWGVVVWIAMLYVVLPILGLPAGGTMPVLLAGFEHLLFGVIVGAGFLPYQRELPTMRRHTTAP